MQFHPEVSRAPFAEWAERYEDVDAEAVLAQYDEKAERIGDGGRALAHRFREIVARHADRTGVPESVLSR